MTKVTLLAAALVGAALFVPPAQAATEAECEAAIRKTQDDASRNAALSANDEKADDLSTMLARAGSAGENGNYEQCLQLVRDARGAAGLRN